jgi:hypothetical protein
LKSHKASNVPGEKDARVDLDTIISLDNNILLDNGTLAEKERLSRGSERMKN